MSKLLPVVAATALLSGCYIGSSPASHQHAAALHTGLLGGGLVTAFAGVLMYRTDPGDASVQNIHDTGLVALSVGVGLIAWGIAGLIAGAATATTSPDD